jgi:hypothetical protein
MRYDIRANTDPILYPLGTAIFTSTDTQYEAEQWIRNQDQYPLSAKIDRMIVHVSVSGHETRVR